MFEYNAKGIPPVEELLTKFAELRSYVQVGKYYEKSDNAVKKWCKKYGIITEIGRLTER